MKKKNPNVKVSKRKRYCVYYPDEGRTSVLMTFLQAKELVKQFEGAYIVNSEMLGVIS